MRVLKHDLNTSLDTDEIYEKIRCNFINTALLESLDGPENLVGQSVICFDPQKFIRINNNALYVNGKRIATGIKAIRSHLQSIIDDFALKTDHPEVFNGGLLGYTGYNFVSYAEPILPNLNPEQNHPIHFPDALYGLFLDGIIVDHRTDEIYYFHHPKVTSRKNLIQHILNEPQQETSDFVLTSDLTYTQSKDDFEEKVETIKEKIIAGEIFQAVISQQASCNFEGNRFELYKRLRIVNPSPYMYCLEFFDIFIVGSSPELLVSLTDNQLTTYPIAGTRPKGKTTEERDRLAKELLADEKEIAEHNMLVDLARNDISKVAARGAVDVPVYMKIEEFSHVIHIVSKVEGRLADCKNQFDAFEATFPAGTVSGAPKLRAIEIIQELEPVNRGPYAGTVGYFGLDGNMVQAIAIRTAFGIGDFIRIQAGAGIVLDSNPSNEYHETIAKLGAFLQVLEKKVTV